MWTCGGEKEKGKEDEGELSYMRLKLIEGDGGEMQKDRRDREDVRDVRDERPHSRAEIPQGLQPANSWL